MVLQETQNNLYLKEGHINYESPIIMLSSMLFWRLFYILCRFLLPNKIPEYSARISSAVHGLVSAFLGINQCFLVDWPFDHPEWKTTYMQSFILAFSFGYFAHDLIWTWHNDRRDKLMVCHHAYCVYALAKISYKGYSGAQASCALGSMEITNPFQQARWFLRSEGMQFTPIFVSTEVTFFIVFVIVRILLGTYFLKVILTQPKNDWDFIFMAVSIYVMSWMFVVTLIKYILKKYVKKGPGRELQKDHD
ncbi:TLC domain-containing protein 5-like [Cylas formicarius]|uniref:TLC domain-containing protein 5-like n=1 Tax=Cylas formicarius TaxID=197179 RepID=UPI002958962F|nr:TLC domain-containing protein 5-like [Cylas formicarius]